MIPAGARVWIAMGHTGTTRIPYPRGQLCTPIGGQYPMPIDTRATGAASISRPGQGSSRPMPMAATVSCMLPVANLALSSRQVASRTRAGSSSSSPTSRVRHARRAAVRRHRSSTRSRWRPCRSSTPCSRSSAISTARTRQSDSLPARSGARH